jgi:hypothetical protein
MNDEDEPLQDDFDEECNDAEEMDMADEFEPLEDDNDEEGSDDDEEAEEDDGSGESGFTESKTGHCRICGANVVVDELTCPPKTDPTFMLGLGQGERSNATEKLHHRTDYQQTTRSGSISQSRASRGGYLPVIQYQ